MYPSHSYESQLPPMQTNQASFGQAPAGSFSQTQPLQAPDYSMPQQQSHHMSAQTYQGPGYGAPKAQEECQDECVEEECDPDQCGDERRGPDADSRVCGIDQRPLLPLGLTVSTFLGGLCMLLCQLPVLNTLIGSYAFVLGIFLAAFSFLYLCVLVCMLYCWGCDPGYLRPEYAQAYTAMDEEALRKGERPKPGSNKPKRAHKTWLYRQPVRRYDHYCRWVTNCIGLLNHREFFIMVSGLVLIGILGTAIDLAALIAVFSRPKWIPRVLILAHLGYSVVLTGLASPILRIHFGLINRNELANEWKRNDFYVVSGKCGELIAVNALSDDDFNDRFDQFIYDKSRNPWDKGGSANCYSFWCTPRWPKQQMGEF